MTAGLLDFTSSVLPHLEPFAGIAFALNLAYIALPRFRYRERIQTHVFEKLKDLNGVAHQFGDTEWYKITARLAAMKDDASDLSPVKLPKESWAGGYVRLFEKHRDRKACITNSFLLGGILALGSAHSAGHFGSFAGYNLMVVFSDSSFAWWFSFLTASALLPVFFVSRGKRVVTGACHYADAQIKNMKTAMQSEVRELENPPLPESVT